MLKVQSAYGNNKANPGVFKSLVKPTDYRRDYSACILDPVSRGHQSVDSSY